MGNTTSTAEQNDIKISSKSMNANDSVVNHDVYTLSFINTASPSETRRNILESVNSVNKIMHEKPNSFNICEYDITIEDLSIFKLTEIPTSFSSEIIEELLHKN